MACSSVAGTVRCTNRPPKGVSDLERHSSPEASVSPDDPGQPVDRHIAGPDLGAERLTPEGQDVEVIRVNGDSLRYVPTATLM
jgi:hypothetical protein